jgi:hypothetical protein
MPWVLTRPGIRGRQRGKIHYPGPHPLERGVEIIKGEGIKRRNDRNPRIIDQHIEPAARSHCLGDSALYRRDVSTIGANCDGVPARSLNRVHNGVGLLLSIDVSDCNCCAFSGQALGNRRTNAARSAGDQCDFASEFLVQCSCHIISPLW